MSGGFSFPPPPPPPPKPQAQQQPYGNQARGRGGGRGRGGTRGQSDQRGRGNGGGRGRGQPNTYGNQQNRDTVWPSKPNQSGPYQIGQQAQAQTRPSNWATGPPSTSGFQSPRPGSGYGTHQATAGSPPRTIAGHKRKADALRGPQVERVKKLAPQTAPAVPSFGGPILPPKPATVTTAATFTSANGASLKPAGRGLGLLPMANDDAYEDSESDDDKDVDEEALYAELGDKLTFEHNGVVMSLKSQADLAAWKKERQRNWPTTARMSEKDEERKRIGEERRRLLAGARVLQRPSTVRTTKSRSRVLQAKSKAQDARLKAETGHDAMQHDQLDVQVDGVKIESVDQKIKAEPLDDTAQRKADRAQQLAELRRKVAASEAKNREAREQIERSHHEISVLEKAQSDKLPTSPSKDAVGISDHEHVENEEETGSTPAPTVEEEDEESDDSSSEVSSDSSSDLDSDSDDSGPEEAASKPTPMPTQYHDRPECKYFAASGYCRDGDACMFRHVQRPQRAAQKDQAQKKKKIEPPDTDTQPERKTIFQRLVEQEQAEADRLALQVINYLGQAGLFSAKDDNSAG